MRVIKYYVPGTPLVGVSGAGVASIIVGGYVYYKDSSANTLMGLIWDGLIMKGTGVFFLIISSKR